MTDAIVPMPCTNAIAPQFNPRAVTPYGGIDSIILFVSKRPPLGAGSAETSGAFHVARARGNAANSPELAICLTLLSRPRAKMLHWSKVACLTRSDRRSYSSFAAIDSISDTS
jgi:hypothetical protein